MGRVLGEEVQYDRDGDGPRPVNAILGREFQALQSGDIRISSKRFEITIAMDEFREVFEGLGDPAPGDLVEVQETDWHVVTPKIDAEGVSWTLTLKRA